MTNRKPYTTDSLLRALVHHGAEFKHNGEIPRRPWIVETPAGTYRMTDAECHAFVAGLAVMRDKLIPTYTAGERPDLSGGRSWRD